MEEKTLKHTKKIFIWDVILIFVLIGFLTAIVHILQYLSERVFINDRNIRLKTGIFSNNETDIPFDKINTIRIRQNLFGKLLNYGSIVIFTGNDVSGIIFNHLDNPKGIKAAIQERIKT